MKTPLKTLAVVRDAIWEHCTRHIPQATRVPAWTVVLRLLLFPQSTLHILARNGHPFDPWTRTWNLYGARFSDRALMAMAGRLPTGRWYRFGRQEPGNLIVIEEVQSVGSAEAERYHAELKILLHAAARFQQDSAEYRGALVRASRVIGLPTPQLRP